MRTMDDLWRIYRTRMKQYSYLVPLGIAVGFIPFLLTLSRWRQSGRMVLGVLVTLAFGTVVSVTMWIAYAAGFGVLTAIQQRTGVNLFDREWLVRTFQVSIGVTGAAGGIRLALFVRDWLTGARTAGNDFLSALVMGGFLSLLIFSYMAYRNAREEALAARATAAETRYRALEAQMQPHFLFNALNTLAELIETDSDKAAAVTYQLSDLYRWILENSRLKTATLASEVRIARRYLELEQLRFGDRLSFSIDVPPDADRIRLPSLILQTLVENAVKHGIARSVAGGHIALDIRPVGDGLYRATLRNPGTDAANGTGTGTGLANTRARLDHLYGTDHGFAIRSENGETTVEFTFRGTIRDDDETNPGG